MRPQTAEITGPRLQLMDMPHYEARDVLMRVETERGLVWYVIDVPYMKGTDEQDRHDLGVSALRAIFGAVLYLYAKNGAAPEGFAASDLQNAMRPA